MNAPLFEGLRHNWILLAALMHVPCAAADLRSHWFYMPSATVSSVGGAKFSDPMSACEAAAEAYTRNHATYYSRSPALGDVYVAPTPRMTCFIDAYSKKNNELHSRGVRIGTAVLRYCRIGEVFSEAASACVSENELKCEIYGQAEGGTLNESSPCISRAHNGPPESCPSSFAGNPINFATGNKFQAENDYLSRGHFLRMVRSYNSLDGLWRHNYSSHMRISQDGQSVAVILSNGRELYFAVRGSSITPSSLGLGTLTRAGTGWRFSLPNGETFKFDVSGRLTDWSSTKGVSYQLAYSGSRINIIDNAGNRLTLTEDNNHQPLSFTAPGVSIIYGYNPDKRLESVTRTIGGQVFRREYHYEVPQRPWLLTGVTDERGIRYARWDYDGQGRAVSSEHAEGADRVRVAYESDSTVAVTNELGKVTKYTFKTIRGKRHITNIEGEPSQNCPDSNSSFTYDENGLLKSKTDSRGNRTTYDYNQLGLEISRTEAAGTAEARTISTTWHSTFNLPLTIMEGKQITTYSYDELGRQLSKSITER